MAEWAFLWLQKQHLHGIDRHEAIRYMLEGAASRSDSTTKVNLLDFAITKTRVSLGEEAPGPAPTAGFVRTMSEDQRITTDNTLRVLKRQISESIDHKQQILLKQQINQLMRSREIAVTHQKLVKFTFSHHLLFSLI